MSDTPRYTVWHCGYLKKGKREMSDTPRTDKLFFPYGRDATAAAEPSLLVCMTQFEILERENAAQLAELTRIAEALGTNEGHSSVTHIEILREELKDCSAVVDRQQEALDRNAEQLAALHQDASSKWAFLEWRDRAEKAEAKIDSLMLEYCPEEMTYEQIARWKKHQIVKEERK